MAVEAVRDVSSKLVAIVFFSQPDVFHQHPGTWLERLIKIIVEENIKIIHTQV